MEVRIPATLVLRSQGDDVKTTIEYKLAGKPRQIYVKLNNVTNGVNLLNGLSEIFDEAYEKNLQEARKQHEEDKKKPEPCQKPPVDDTPVPDNAPIPTPQVAPVSDAYLQDKDEKPAPVWKVPPLPEPEDKPDPDQANYPDPPTRDDIEKVGPPDGWKPGDD